MSYTMLLLAAVAHTAQASSCTPCTDTPSPSMTTTCAHYQYGVTQCNRCNATQDWINNRYCERSCYVAGCGYAGEPCCLATPVTIGSFRLALPETFVAHGWEPVTATQAFEHFADPAFARAFGHLRGQTVRFGGISADFLAYFVDANVAPACRWSDLVPFFAQDCDFPTGSFDHLLDFLLGAGVKLLFDLNQLSGRNCTQPGPKPWQPAQWCGDSPAPWDTAPVRALLTHVRSRGLEGLVGFELGNELHKPPHISPETATKDIGTLALIFAEIWSGETEPPVLYAHGTNDCPSRNSSDTMAALQAVSSRSGFSAHSYPGGGSGHAHMWWEKYDLTTYLLDVHWLREETLSEVANCLAAWNDGPRAAGVTMAITEGAATYGNGWAAGAPQTNAFIHGFFTIAQLGQFAREGISMVARWSVTTRECGTIPTHLPCFAQSLDPPHG